MQLARMDDIVGCRMIFPTLKDLNEFRGAFQWARFNHTRKNGDAEFAADLKKNLGLDVTL
jgi:putative GTP pyrophosphokinase